MRKQIRAAARKLSFCKQCGNTDPKLCSSSMRLATTPLVEFDEDTGKPIMKDGRLKFRTDPVHGLPLKQVAGVYYEVKCLNCGQSFKAYDPCFLRCVSNSQPERTNKSPERTQVE